MLRKVLNLLHNFSENLWAVLRRIPILYQANFDIKFKLVADILIVEPNVKEHKVFKLTDYKEAYEKADIVVFLTAHDPFKELSYTKGKVILDFCGIYKR